jgi:O-antigen/teichoic acid export membrane protein
VNSSVELKSSSIKKNTLANYIGQGYTLIIMLAVTPLYLEYLGGEAYGLVGFFALMQAWLNILDVGLTPALGRQIAYARCQVNGMENFNKLLKSFEVIFLVIAICTVVIVLFSSDWISLNWLKPKELDPTIITYCINLMGIMVGFRWFASLYRSGINGLEDQVWLNISNIVIVTLKFIGALILLIFVTTDVAHFFEYQAVIGLLELIILMTRFYSRLPEVENKTSPISFHWDSVKAIAPFSLAIAYTSGLWILTTQVDKLALSGILSLKEFGYFSLIVLVSGSINALTVPISQAIQPRMTYLLSSGKNQEMLQLYRNATQLVTLVAASLSIMIAIFSEQLIYAWTGDKEIATWSKEILFWFALGNGVLAVLAFQYYLQVAHGKLRLHAIGATLSAIIDIPIIIYVVINYGALGAGMAWFGLRLIWFVVWTYIVHKQFAPGLHLKWLINDVLIIVFSVFALGYLVTEMFALSVELERYQLFLSMVAYGAIVLMLSSVSSNFIRSQLKNKVVKIYAKIKK